jgi:hypothetical protein
MSQLQSSSYSSQFSQTLFRVTYFGEHFERIHRYHNMISTISAFQSTPFVLKSTNTLNDIDLGAFKKICEHYDSQVQIYFDHSNVPHFGRCHFLSRLSITKMSVFEEMLTLFMVQFATFILFRVHVLAYCLITIFASILLQIAGWTTFTCCDNLLSISRLYLTLL